MKGYGLLVFAALAGLLCFGRLVAAVEVDIASLIQQAGDADDDRQRLSSLKELQAALEADDPLRRDVDSVVEVADRWVNDPRLFQWFHREVRDKLDYEFGISEDSPLYPLTYLYRARMLIWTANEYGNILGYHDQRRKFFDRAVEQLEAAREAFPENRIVRMYLGEPIPPAKRYDVPDGTPAWAAAQRESLERLTDLILWWIDNRLQPDGQYGGGWDDDCEMWRHWVSVMIGFEHPRISEAQAFFSERLLSQDYMRGGYTSRTYDVEHTAEPSSDTITPMMHLAPDDADWSARSRRLAERMSTVWTGRNQRGRLQFKSTYFNATGCDPNPLRACDTPYHVRAIEPALVLWLRTGDEDLGRLFTDWLDTWVAAAASEERGKPAGIIPAAIRWPSGEPAGPGDQWWDPRHHDEPRLYEWPSAMNGMCDGLLLAYHMTGDEKYLEPLRSMAAARLDWLQDRSRGDVATGSRLWCGGKLGFLAATLVKYKLLTGSNEFDELLDRDYGSSSGGRLDPNDERLVRGLERTAKALAINFPGRTSEVRWTDRVFAFARMFGDDMLHPQAVAECNLRPDLSLLYNSVTGDRGKFQVFPLNAVRWLTPPREIAALVTQRAADRFSARLYHFGTDSREMGAELYLLKPGRYRLTLLDFSGNTIIEPTEFIVHGPRTRVELTLPSRMETTMNVERLGDG